MHRFIFLDTNIFLHYQNIDSIDWCKEVDADSVTLVIPPVTIRELNKSKDYSPNPARVRKRAATVLNRLYALFKSDLESQVREGATARLEPRDPLINFEEHHLSREVQDDHVIAMILMYQQELPDAQIVLVTSDNGLTLMAKARQHSIETIHLSDDLKLPDEPDPQEQEMKKLQQELNQLKAKSPKLALTFDDSHQHGKFVLPTPVQLSQEDLTKKIDALKEKYPKLSDPETRIANNSISQKMLTDLAPYFARAVTLSTISPEDIKAYNDALENYYLNYAKYLQRMADYENLNRRTITLEFWLANDGTAPADDVDIFLYFPDGFTLRTNEEFPSGPNPPKPPSPPKSQIEKITEGVGSNFYIPHPDIHRDVSPIQPPSNVSPPTIKRTKSYDVEVHVERIKHTQQEPLDPLLLTFDSFEEAHSFQIGYEIVVASPPDEFAGQLHIIIEREQGGQES